eukprot:6506039-Karenia_brevis.AAC.1
MQWVQSETALGQRLQAATLFPDAGQIVEKYWKQLSKRMGIHCNNAPIRLPRNTLTHTSLNPLGAFC